MNPSYVCIKLQSLAFFNILFVWFCDFCADGFSEGIHTLKLVVKLCSCISQNRGGNTKDCIYFLLSWQSSDGRVTLFTQPQGVAELKGVND